MSWRRITLNAIGSLVIVAVASAALTAFLGTRFLSRDAVSVDALGLARRTEAIEQSISELNRRLGKLELIATALSAAAGERAESSRTVAPAAAETNMPTISESSLKAAINDVLSKRQKDAEHLELQRRAILAAQVYAVSDADALYRVALDLTATLERIRDDYCPYGVPPPRDSVQHDALIKVKDGAIQAAQAVVAQLLREHDLYQASAVLNMIIAEDLRQQ